MQQTSDPGAAIQRIEPLGFAWPTQDPFLFCVHHDDHFPAGNEQMGPHASLEGRDLGQDFVVKDGWRMYHGRVVPGFPQHPHRGFETVTIVRKGLIDHSDSMGAVGRYGRGDTQWMTAGSGILHAEMFPLLDPHGPNPLELFQIWLNLPARSKLVDPHFKMIWSEQTPRCDIADDQGHHTRVAIIAGTYGGITAPAPPPHSWASQADSDVAIWTITMEPHATWVLPRARAGTGRALYLFSGTGLWIGSREIPAQRLVVLESDVDVPLRSSESAIEMLLLQGKPIGEPIAQHGPFVMNTRGEILDAIHDYQGGKFGRWQWAQNDPVHPREQGRFARYPDGREERPLPM